MRRRLARWLRHLGDRVDPTSGPRAMGAYFAFVPGQGLVITQTGAIRTWVPGVQLWYMAEDYHKAWR